MLDKIEKNQQLLSCGMLRSKPKLSMREIEADTKSMILLYINFSRTLDIVRSSEIGR